MAGTPDTLAISTRPEEAPDVLVRSAVPRHRFKDLNLLSSRSFHIGSFSGQLLRWGFLPAAPWRNYLHRHSFFEVCYGFQGRGIFRIWGADYAVQAGEVFVARPGEPHEIIAADADPLGIYHWAYTLVPQRDQRTDTWGTDALLHAFLASDGRVSGQTRGIERILELLTEEIAQREPGYGDIVDGLIVKLVLDTARAVVDVSTLPGPTDPPARSGDATLGQAMIRFLHDNYSQPIAVRDVAAQVHLSERHSNRLFQATTGKSIMRFLAALRLDIAAQRLLEHQRSIKEIAFLSGYPDVRHFTTRFRQRTGLTPAKFRQTRGTVFFPPQASDASHLDD